MTTTTQSVQIAVIWSDEDVAQYRVRASNGRYSGEADCYGSHDTPQEWASALSGFPTSLDDRRELQLGTFDRDYAGGGCRLRFSVVNRRGHSKVNITLRAEPESEDQSTFDLAIATSEVDRFVAGLRSMVPVDGSRAELLGLSDMW